MYQQSKENIGSLMVDMPAGTPLRRPSSAPAVRLGLAWLFSSAPSWIVRKQHGFRRVFQI
jgi:hypothetical protein